MKTRINYFFLVLLIGLFSSAAFAQIAPKPTNATPSVPTGPTTTVKFEHTVYDFGTIRQGEKVQHSYTFTNTGNEPLILSNAKGSCGCTVPSWPKEPVMPGETASITVEFNSQNKKGPRNQKVTITANTRPVAYTFLYLKGEVEVPADGLVLETPESNPADDLTNMDCVAVYPNPTSDILKLDLKESIGKSAVISIYSKNGQLMAERSFDQIEGTIEFSVGHYPSGAYIANVRIDGQKPIAQCFVVGN